MGKRLIGMMIGALLVVTSIFVIGGDRIQSSTTNDDTNILPFANVLVRIDMSEGNIQLPKGLEIVGGKPGEYLNVILPQERLSELSNGDISYSVEINDVDTYTSFAMPREFNKESGTGFLLAEVTIKHNIGGSTFIIAHPVSG